MQQIEVITGAQPDTQKGGQQVCVCVFESERRVMTHPWAAEGAGGETR